MLKQLIIRLIAARHPWRTAQFDELSELYVSVLFRGIAISLSGLFVPVFMFRLGYGITQILMVFAAYFTVRIGIDFVSAHFIARYGPKHTILVGYILQIVSLIFFLTLTMVEWPIILLGGVWGASASFFFIPFQVGFSKVKHREHGGKELSLVHIMEKSGAAVGPIIGGIIATVFGAQYTFLASIIFLMAGLIPLFSTAEPVRTHQELRYKDLDIGKIRRDLVSFAALGIENTLCLCLWPLFLGMFVLLDASVYAKLGGLVSVAVLISLASAYYSGRAVDAGDGRRLMRVSASVNAILHGLRLFTTTYPAAIAISVMNEMVTFGYQMPYKKAMYDAADDHPGLRIVYVSSMEGFSSLAKATAWWLLVIFSLMFTPYATLSIGFIIAAIASLMIMTERYKTLAPRAYTRG